MAADAAASAALAAAAGCGLEAGAAAPRATANAPLLPEPGGAAVARRRVRVGGELETARRGIAAMAFAARRDLQRAHALLAHDQQLEGGAGADPVLRVVQPAHAP